LRWSSQGLGRAGLTLTNLAWAPARSLREKETDRTKLWRAILLDNISEPTPKTDIDRLSAARDKAAKGCVGN